MYPTVSICIRFFLQKSCNGQGRMVVFRNPTITRKWGTFVGSDHYTTFQRLGRVMVGRHLSNGCTHEYLLPHQIPATVIINHVNYTMRDICESAQREIVFYDVCSFPSIQNSSELRITYNDNKLSHSAKLCEGQLQFKNKTWYKYI